MTPAFYDISGFNELSSYLQLRSAKLFTSYHYKDMGAFLTAFGVVSSIGRTGRASFGTQDTLTLVVFGPYAPMHVIFPGAIWLTI